MIPKSCRLFGEMAVRLDSHFAPELRDHAPRAMRLPQKIAPCAERFCLWRIIRVAGRHPPSPRAWLAEYEAQSTFGRLRLIVFAQCLFSSGVSLVLLPHAIARNRTRWAGVCQAGNFNQRRTRMNWDRIEGNWKEIKGKVHQQWGKLTNDDLETIHGKRMELAGRLQQRYGIAKDDAERQIDDWLKTMH
jgi:uncharacterized protein YjbJ (UPF0337 family)